MATFAKGLTTIDNQTHLWTEDDKKDLLEFAVNPSNGVTAILLYLNQRNVKCSIASVHRWLKEVRNESDRIKRMRVVFDDYKGLSADEINAYVAASMADVMVALQESIALDGNIDLKKIQSLTSLAKEARSSALAMNTPHSSASMKELELGFAMAFIDKLEGIFEEDEALLERIKNACKAILIEIEGQYQC